MKTANIKLSLFNYALNLGVMGVILIAILRVILLLYADGLYPLASVLSAIAVFLAIIYLRRRFTPVRWFGIGIALALLFTLYPILYTFYLSTTNMKSGHLMTKQQAINQLEDQTYLVEGDQSYGWTAFVNPGGEYALWLMPDEGAGLLAFPGEPLEEVPPGEKGVGELDEDRIPISLEGYERLPQNKTVAIIAQLGEINFGEDPNIVRIRSLREAAPLKQKYQYDSDLDAVVDLETGEIYRPIDGTFTSTEGAELAPGYIVFAGVKNFDSFLGNPGFREPLFQILLWNISFAFWSVALSFALGLVVTLLFEGLPGSRIIRALLIIPWPIPVLISILIWRSMLDPDVGFVAPVLESIFGSSPAWFQDKNWTRIGVIMVNVWLSYPYFYVISAGAIRSIPHEIYDAAVVDGAGPWNKFYHISLPLLLRILMPLLIASFTFNFNNFNVIYIFNFGKPAMPNTVVPMGHTDILISFVYRLAFITTNVTNYGLAAAITVMLFLLIAIMVVFQARFTNLFREVD
ncbi:MAG: ABC transporter permease subunit [Anaerolineae bacterium]|nr:ABC transporter permease subunit [Anaerolineae bacterium]